MDKKNVIQSSFFDDMVYLSEDGDSVVPDTYDDNNEVEDNKEYNDVETYGYERQDDNYDNQEHYEMPYDDYKQDEGLNEDAVSLEEPIDNIDESEDISSQNEVNDVQDEVFEEPNNVEDFEEPNNVDDFDEQQVFEETNDYVTQDFNEQFMEDKKIEIENDTKIENSVENFGDIVYNQDDIEQTDTLINVEEKMDDYNLREEAVTENDISNSTGTNIAKICVLGVGGGGTNAVNRMIDGGVQNVTFYAVNTDKQALMLSKCPIENRIVIGENTTKGLGAGAHPEVGEAACKEDRAKIEKIVKGVDLLFITAGMGGGTGTGAAPVIAKIAKENGCVTVAVVTKPFAFEGRVREENARKGIENLRKFVDTIIIIPNNKLLETLGPNTTMLDAFKYADTTLYQGVCGISDIITIPSVINLDFADVKTILEKQGFAHMGIGVAKGENRVVEAVRQAVCSPLLETTIEGANGVILNVTGGEDISISQVIKVADLVRAELDPSANIIFGMTIKHEMQEQIMITLIATGFNQERQQQLEEEQIRPIYTSRPIQQNTELIMTQQGGETQPVEEPKQEEQVEVKEEKGKGGLPSFVKRLFGGKK